MGTLNSSETDGSDVLVLVHGTRAPQGEGDGGHEDPSWNENGSEFVRMMREFLPEIELEVVSVEWSGDNLESQRHEAADVIRKRIEQLELEQRSYHVISHSHGGSAVWLMLKNVTQSHVHGRPHKQALQLLPRMKSWCTVGTPFLHYEPVNDRWWWLLTAGLPFVAAMIYLWCVYPGAADLITGGDLPDWGWGTVALTGIRNFWIESLWNRIRLMAAITCLVLSAIVLVFFGLRRTFRAVTGWWFLRQQKAVTDRAWSQFHSRWLGLHSAHDEAVHGLRHSLGLSGAVVPRAHNRNRLVRWLLAPIRWTYNTCVARVGDSFIWSMLTARAQGNDTSEDLRYVSPSPHPAKAGWPTLPSDVDSAMRKEADRQAAHTLEVVRQQFGLSEQSENRGTAFVQDMLGRLSWGELIHTSYFPRSASRFDGVTRLIAHHVQHCSNRGEDSGEPSITNDDGRDWYNAHQASEELNRPATIDHGSARRIDLRLSGAIVGSLILIGSGLWLRHDMAEIRDLSDQKQFTLVAARLNELHDKDLNPPFMPYRAEPLPQPPPLPQLSPSNQTIPVTAQAAPQTGDSTDAAGVEVPVIVPHRTEIPRDLETAAILQEPEFWPAWELSQLLGPSDPGEMLDMWAQVRVRRQISTAAHVIAAMADSEGTSDRIRARIAERELSLNAVTRKLAREYVPQTVAQTDSPITSPPFNTPGFTTTGNGDSENQFYVPWHPLASVYAAAEAHSALEDIMNRRVSSERPAQWADVQSVFAQVPPPPSYTEADANVYDLLSDYVLAWLTLHSGLEEARSIPLLLSMGRPDAATQVATRLLSTFQGIDSFDEEKVQSSLKALADDRYYYYYSFIDLLKTLVDRETEEAHSLLGDSALPEVPETPGLECGQDGASLSESQQTQDEEIRAWVSVCGAVSKRIDELLEFGEWIPREASKRRLENILVQLRSLVFMEGVPDEAATVMKLAAPLVDEIRMLDAEDVDDLYRASQTLMTAATEAAPHSQVAPLIVNALLPRLVASSELGVDPLEWSVTALALSYRTPLPDVRRRLRDAALNSVAQIRVDDLSRRNTIQYRWQMVQTIGQNAIGWEGGGGQQERALESVETAIGETREQRDGVTVVEASIWQTLLLVTALRLEHDLGTPVGDSLDDLRALASQLDRVREASAADYVVVASQLAVAFAEFGSPDEGVALLDAASRITGSVGDEVRSMAQRELSIAYTLCGRYRAAIEAADPCDAPEKYRALLEILHDMAVSRHGPSPRPLVEIVEWQRREVELQYNGFWLE